AGGDAHLQGRPARDRPRHAGSGARRVAAAARELAEGEPVSVPPVMTCAAACGRRCIPPGGVARRSNIPDILTPRALPAGRLAALGATLELSPRAVRLAANAQAKDVLARLEPRIDE